MKGKLRVHIIRGDFTSDDDIFGKMDPYLQITLG